MLNMFSASCEPIGITVLNLEKVHSGEILISLVFISCALLQDVNAATAKKKKHHLKKTGFLLLALCVVPSKSFFFSKSN